MIETTDPRHEIMETELFGPILTVFPYQDGSWDDILGVVEG